jgi:hypothetical protein
MYISLYELMYIVRLKMDFLQKPKTGGKLTHIYIICSETLAEYSFFT